MKKMLESKVFQITPVNKYSPEARKVTSCEAMVQGAEIAPII